MSLSELDNPFFSSLRMRHAAFALGDQGLCRYPAEVAPFLGVVSPDAATATGLDTLMPRGDTALLLGVMPRPVEGYALEVFRPLAQMICEQPITPIDGPEIIELDERHHDDILGLIALVYPHYFRQRTPELGRYFGIYQPDSNGDVRLAAMIGERLGTHDTREMSAICTHPDFLGRGYAGRLTAMLTNDTLEHGLPPFLHVSQENPRAKQLYERLGYRTRYEIPFAALRRSAQG
ncbi:MAG: GNAT family N-acetyltransferase [Lysobacteraceae bacterium]